MRITIHCRAHDSSLFLQLSNGENIILTANDFIDPLNSPAFALLKAVPSLAQDATNLANICAAPVKGIPTLEDFLAGRNIPSAPIIVRPLGEGAVAKKEAAYVGAYDVIEANNYAMVAKQVGNRVELVGVVTKVHMASTKYGKRYCFVFFGHSRLAVKLNIWSEGLLKLTTLTGAISRQCRRRSKNMTTVGDGNAAIRCRRSRPDHVRRHRKFKPSAVCVELGLKARRASLRFRLNFPHQA